MPSYIDQTGREVEIAAHPKRIISLVPSQTELLSDLGLENEVVGITKFCIHPDEWFRNKTRVGGTKTLHIETIRLLQPDLIIANKEENNKEQIEMLAREFPVWVSDVIDQEDAYSMIESVGEICGKIQEAERIIHHINNEFLELEWKKRTAAPTLRQACYLIWKDPYMTIGNDCFIHHMMQAAGFVNVFSGMTRYPRISLKEVPVETELVFLSSEPYPFTDKHIEEIKAVLPHAVVLLVDGEMFSWYGSRLQLAPRYFLELRDQIKALS